MLADERANAIKQEMMMRRRGHGRALCFCIHSPQLYQVTSDRSIWKDMETLLNKSFVSRPGANEVGLNE